MWNKDGKQTFATHLKEGHVLCTALRSQNLRDRNAAKAISHREQKMEMLKMETEETLAHSRAFIFVLDHYVQLLKAGFGDAEFYFGNSSRVTYIYDVNTSEIVTACVWSIDPNRRSGTIHFSATEQSRRQQGHYKKVFNEVQRLMADKGVVALYSSVHLDNQPMIAAAESSGRKQTYYRTKKSLRKP